MSYVSHRELRAEPGFRAQQISKDWEHLSWKAEFSSVVKVLSASQD